MPAEAVIGVPSDRCVSINARSSLEFSAVRRTPWSDGYADVEGAKPRDEYRFLIRNGDAVLSRIDPYARAVTTSVGNGIVIDPTHDWHGGGFEARAWNELVIYEMHIGTFHRPDETTAGTFADAIEKLGHLKQLGVNAVQIMPAMEFAGGISWGYNPAHIFAVESTYGGPAGFKAFIEAAHQSGIAVILDVVYNHFAPATSTSGSSTAGARTTRAGSTSTTTGAAIPPGATPGPTMGAARFASSSGTMRFTGWTNTTSTGCAST
jgi:Alpha amylase, catalytic domain